MADDRPMWRRAFDAVEKNLTPQLEQMVRTEQFADVASAFTRMQLEFQRRAERSLRQTWHFWNLPAGSDVKRLTEQVASLERRVRELSKQLQDQEGLRNGRPAETTRPSQPNPS